MLIFWTSWKNPYFLPFRVLRQESNPQQHCTSHSIQLCGLGDLRLCAVTVSGVILRRRAISHTLVQKSVVRRLFSSERSSTPTCSDCFSQNPVIEKMVFLRKGTGFRIWCLHFSTFWSKKLWFVFFNRTRDSFAKLQVPFVFFCHYWSPFFWCFDLFGKLLEPKIFVNHDQAFEEDIVVPTFCWILHQRGKYIEQKKGLVLIKKQHVKQPQKWHLGNAAFSRSACVQDRVLDWEGPILAIAASAPPNVEESSQVTMCIHNRHWSRLNTKIANVCTHARSATMTDVKSFLDPRRFIRGWHRSEFLSDYTLFV